MCYSLWYNAPTILPAGSRQATSWVHYTTSCNTQSSAPEDGRDQRPKHVELIVIINKPLLLHLFGVYIIYKVSLVHNLFLVHLSFCTHFRRICAHHQEKQLCLCDTCYLLFRVDDCLHTRHSSPYNNKYQV